MVAFGYHSISYQCLLASTTNTWEVLVSVSLCHILLLVGKINFSFLEKINFSVC